MRRLPGRLGFLQLTRNIRLRKLANAKQLDHTNFTKVLQDNRNTRKYISVLESAFGIPITTIRAIYKEDKGKKMTRNEFLEWAARNAN